VDLRPRRRARRERERLRHEEPGWILRGTPIAITCECGEGRDLRYGEAWHGGHYVSSGKS
jgi:hypothetical protein